MYQILGIRKPRTTALHPPSDGMVERFTRTLEEFLGNALGDLKFEIKQIQNTGYMTSVYNHMIDMALSS